MTDAETIAISGGMLVTRASAAAPAEHESTSSADVRLAGPTTSQAHP